MIIEMGNQRVRSDVFEGIAIGNVTGSDMYLCSDFSSASAGAWQHSFMLGKMRELDLGTQYTSSLEL